MFDDVAGMLRSLLCGPSGEEEHAKEVRFESFREFTHEVL